MKPTALAHDGAASPGRTCPRHACSGDTVTPGRVTLTDARGAETPGIAAGLNAPSPALTSGGARGAGQTARSRVRAGINRGSEVRRRAPAGAGRPGPTSMPPPPGEAADAFTGAARAGRKMAARHSPITPPPSPPPSACRAVCCHRRFPATRRQGPTRRRWLRTQP